MASRDVGGMGTVDQEDLKCPICLELYRDPAALPCGHFFCLGCIGQHWEVQGQALQRYTCPTCNDAFYPRPQLARNPLLCQIVGRVPCGTPEVDVGAPEPEAGGLCGLCTGARKEAVKLCLTCMISLCPEHLRPHREHAAYLHHRLVHPSGDFRKDVCTKHYRLLELYCLTDGARICYECFRQEHVGHDTTSMKEIIKIEQKLHKLEEKVGCDLEDIEERISAADGIAGQIKAAAKSHSAVITKAMQGLLRCTEDIGDQALQLLSAEEAASLESAETNLQKLQEERETLKETRLRLRALQPVIAHVPDAKVFISVHGVGRVSSGVELVPEFKERPEEVLRIISRLVQDVERRILLTKAELQQQRLPDADPGSGPPAPSTPAPRSEGSKFWISRGNWKPKIGIPEKTWSPGGKAQEASAPETAWPPGGKAPEMGAPETTCPPGKKPAFKMLYTDDSNSRSPEGAYRPRKEATTYVPCGRREIGNPCSDERCMLCTITSIFLESDTGYKVSEV